MSLYQSYQTKDVTQVISTSGFDAHALVTISRAVGSSTAASLMRLCEAVLNANSLQAQYELDDLFGFAGDGDNINSYNDTDPLDDADDPDPDSS